VLRACTSPWALFGFRVVVAENGAAGLDVFLRLRGEICLVLSDIIMPAVNGITSSPFRLLGAAGEQEDLRLFFVLGLPRQRLFGWIREKIKECSSTAAPYVAYHVSLRRRKANKTEISSRVDRLLSLKRRYVIDRSPAVKPRPFMDA
jgi:hypothetical protein